MADENKGKWWRFIKNALISFLEDAGILAALKVMLPELYKLFGGMVGDHVKQKIQNDKRAEMLREFRKMNDAGINLDNLWRRHEESITALHEDHFVELLCKIPPPDPEDPSTARPSVSPVTSGQPTNDRQADILWLNNMTDERFKQAMYFLDHDVVTQWYQRSCLQLSRICKKLWEDAKKTLPVIFAGLGITGVAILGILRVLWHFAVRFVRWASGNLFRIAIVVIIAAVIFWPLALIAMLILKAFHSFFGGSRENVTPRQRGIGFLGFIGTLIGIPLLVGMYFELVPTSIDAKLIPVVLMGIVATLCFWRVRLLRVGLLSLITVLTLIFFLGGRTAAKNEIKSMWTNNQGGQGVNDTVADLQSTIAAQNAELATIRQQTNEGGKAKNPSLGLAGNGGNVVNTGSLVIEEPLHSARRDASTPEKSDTPQTSIATTPPPVPTEVGWKVGDITIIINHCVHKLKQSDECEVTISSDAADPQEFAFKEGGIATDQKGHAVPIFLGNITSAAGEKAILQNGDMRTFTFSFKDTEFGNSPQAKIMFHVRQCSADHSRCDYGDTSAPKFVKIS